MKNEKNFLEKKEKRNRIIMATVFLVMALIILNFIYLYLGGLYKISLGLVAFISFDILVIYIYLCWIGVKFPKRKLPSWFKSEMDNLNQIYKTFYDDFLKVEKVFCTEYNNICPKCKVGKDKIVDAISNVKGGGDVDLFFGTGLLTGEVKTLAINKCSNCSHEWEKYEVNYSEAEEQALNKFFGPLYYYFTTGTKLDYDESSISRFHADVVKKFIKDNQCGYMAKELKILSISDLKRYGCK